MRPTLHILTESYPYGTGEVFVGEEIDVLSDYYNIIYYPRETKGFQRKVSKNINVNLAIAKRSSLSKIYTFIKKGAFVNYWKFYFKRSKPNRVRSARNFLGYCIDGHSIANEIDKIQIEKEDILYSYWFKHTAFAIALSNKECTKITRAHRTDIYEIDYSLPFHNRISEGLDKVFSISKDGYNYLRDIHGISSQKLAVSKLGTIRKYKVEKEKQKNGIEIVSCSSLIERKRVGDIMKAIKVVAKKTNSPISWTHFGGGPLMNLLKKEALDKPSNLNIHLNGQSTNDEVHKNYATRNYDCFINFSTSEGIPVSIMEAMSYGIPCVATDVGGTKEALTEECGILLKADSDVYLLAKAIIKVIETDIRYSSNTIERWNKNYSAVKNYNKFARDLIKLSKHK